MIREEIKKSYLAAGGLQENLTNDSQTIQGILKAKNNIATNSIAKVGIAAADPEAEYFNVKVKTYQSNVKVEKGHITGKLKFVEGGLAPSGYLSGDGYFLALVFEDDVDPTTIEVGLVPSTESGLVALDSDFAGVFKITDKDKQNFIIKKTVDGVEKIQAYDLTGLIFA